VFTTGALVSAAQANALTTIQRLDPIYVDIQQSSADVLKLRQAIMAGKVSKDGNAKVALKLEDGNDYGPQGTLRFADVTVDQTTGSQIIRALFPNPNGLLLPGMFVRAHLVEGTQQNAMLVPQRAVSRDERGNPVVLVVGAENKIEPRPIQTSRTAGDSWIVTSGLKPGDKVIVEGAMMLRPGMPVTPQPWNPNAKPADGQGQPGAAAPPRGSKSPCRASSSIAPSSHGSSRSSSCWQASSPSARCRSRSSRRSRRPPSRSPRPIRARMPRRWKTRRRRSSSSS
jgi:membrane fusion protein (multidrug efflux system)